MKIHTTNKRKMIGYCPLASGSKGNSIFLRSKKTKILIDAGLSAKMLEEKLQTIGESLSNIDAILVTHEHSDHIKGLDVISRKWKIPIFCNGETAKAILRIFPHLHHFKIFTTGETFSFADLTILPFSVQHDTMDPVAFLFQYDQMKIGFCTDIGFVSPIAKYHLKGCQYLYLESNHQPAMVHASSRPYHNKMRILGPSGHLSNEDAARLLLEVWSPSLKHVHLAHLSEECNSPAVALQIVQNTLRCSNKFTPVDIAWQHQISKFIAFE